METLDRVRGKSQSAHQRKGLAIELSALILEEASINMTPEEREIQGKLSAMIRDPVGKAFTMAMTDQAKAPRSPCKGHGPGILPAANSNFGQHL